MGGRCTRSEACEEGRGGAAGLGCGGAGGEAGVGASDVFKRQNRASLFRTPLCRGYGLYAGFHFLSSSELDVELWGGQGQGLYRSCPVVVSSLDLTRATAGNKSRV